MKNDQVFNCLAIMATAFIFVAPWPVIGQQTPDALEEVKRIDGLYKAPPEEHLKVEDGNPISIKEPGKDWVNTRQAPTVGNAAKALRRIYTNSTFVVDPRVADISFKDLIVRANDPRVDLEALRTACSGMFSFSGGANDFYTIDSNGRTELGLGKKSDRNVQCFNLSGYLDRMAKLHPQTNQDRASEELDKAIGELNSIIEHTITDFDSSIPHPSIQFYAQAELVIVTGPQAGIDIAAKVIHALPGQPVVYEPGPDSGYSQMGFRLNQIAPGIFSAETATEKQANPSPLPPSQVNKTPNRP